MLLMTMIYGRSNMSVQYDYLVFAFYQNFSLIRRIKKHNAKNSET